jgi:ribosome-binding ATPase YchF (GTP1/OBG family)
MSDKEIVRGAEADRILKHEILVEAFDTVREGIVRAMTNSAMGDTNTHNRLVIALQLLSQIEKHIQEVATTGKLARIQVDESMLSKAKRVFN